MKLLCGDIDGKGTRCCFHIEAGYDCEYCRASGLSVYLSYECHCVEDRQAELRRQLEAGEKK